MQDEMWKVPGKMEFYNKKYNLVVRRICRRPLSSAPLESSL